LGQLQYAALMVLDDMPGIDQRRLAEALGIAPFNAGQLVIELAALGLVDRRTNGADRRARSLRLTPSGHSLCQKLRPRNLAANRRILGALAPKEKKTFLDLLVRVIESNETYARPGAGRRKQGADQKHSNKADNDLQSNLRENDLPRHIGSTFSPSCCRSCFLVRRWRKAVRRRAAAHSS